MYRTNCQRRSSGSRDHDGIPLGKSPSVRNWTSALSGIACTLGVCRLGARVPPVALTPWQDAQCCAKSLPPARISDDASRGAGWDGGATAQPAAQITNSSRSLWNFIDDLSRKQWDFIGDSEPHQRTVTVGIHSEGGAEFERDAIGQVPGDGGSDVVRRAGELYLPPFAEAAIHLDAEGEILRTQ